MTLKEIVDRYNNILILSGAGVSTASGLKDFRSNAGLYSKSNDPMRILSRDYYYANPQSTINYIVDNFIIGDHIKANLGHKFAYDLFKLNKLVGVVTQNVDGLYEQTGLDENYIVPIHGEANIFYCSLCQAKVLFADINTEAKSPCCNAILDTNVVLYGDNFHAHHYNTYMQMLSKADCVIIMGTTLHIGAHLYNALGVDVKVLINNERIIDLDNHLDHAFIGDINEILEDSYYNN